MPLVRARASAFSGRDRSSPSTAERPSGGAVAAAWFEDEDEELGSAARLDAAALTSVILTPASPEE